MAYTTTSYMPLKMPTPGTREPANISLLNENSVVLAGHDHSNGKGLPVVVLRSGLLANRPAAGNAGAVYMATDTGLFYVDTGTAWASFLTSSGAATVSGWTLVDPIVRDTISFGPEPTGAADAAITRPAANALRTDNRFGVGFTPSDWHVNFRVIQLGSGGSTSLWNNGGSTFLTNNSWHDGTNYKAVAVGAGLSLQLTSTGNLSISTAPSVAAGASQVMTERFLMAPSGLSVFTLSTSGGISITGAAGQSKQINFQTAGLNRWAIEGANAVAEGGANAGSNFIIDRFNDAGAFINVPFQINRNNGTVTITSDAGAPGLQVSTPPVANQIAAYFNCGAGFYIDADAGNFPRIRVNSYLMIDPAGNNLLPGRDAAINLGTVGNRWSQVAAVLGTIQTSTADMKQDFALLDPAACVEAVLGTDWLSFSYLPPVYQEPAPTPQVAYGASDSNEAKAEKRAARDESEAQAKADHLRLLAETAPARDQKGYVLQSPDYTVHDLFGLSDRTGANASSDLAVVACALQSALQRIAALESANA